MCALPHPFPNCNLDGYYKDKSNSNTRFRRYRADIRLFIQLASYSSGSFDARANTKSETSRITNDGGAFGLSFTESRRGQTLVWSARGAGGDIGWKRRRVSIRRPTI